MMLLRVLGRRGGFLWVNASPLWENVLMWALLRICTNAYICLYACIDVYILFMTADECVATTRICVLYMYICM